MLGKSVPLSIGRKFLIDLFWLAKRAPVSVISGKINIKALVMARDACERPPFLSAIIVKAFAVAARDIPELRQSYLKFPVPHLHETFKSSVSLMVERQIDGTTAVIPVLLKSPEEKTLAAIANEIHAAKTKPQNEVRQIHRLLRITRLPLPIRRLLWLVGYHSGRQRGNYFGNIAISALGHSGSLITYPLSCVTTFLSYGRIEDDGSVEVRIGFDHRVYDGATVAKTISALESCLNREMVSELQAI